MVGFKFPALTGKTLHQRIGQNEELLVAGRVHCRRESQCFQAVPQAEGLPVCVTGQLSIKAVLQENLKLQAQKPSLGQHRAPAFHQPAEIRAGLGEYQGLPKERAVFRPPDGKGVCQAGQVRQGQVRRFQG